jgi:hypothetical protein
MVSSGGWQPPWFFRGLSLGRGALPSFSHKTGEEDGMDGFARWLRTIVSDVPIVFFPAGDQFLRM